LRVFKPKNFSPAPLEVFTARPILDFAQADALGFQARCVFRFVCQQLAGELERIGQFASI
jgi:hypothetical protein